jgi:3-oxoacyl-[acyl-carrier protein] reductase
MSSSLRSGFVSLFKSLSKIKKKEKISFINIAPGPIKTQRLINLLKKEKKTLKSFSKEMPGNIIPEPKEIGLFVEFIVKNKIKSLNGLTIPFDSGMLQSI